MKLSPNQQIGVVLFFIIATVWILTIAILYGWTYAP